MLRPDQNADRLNYSDMLQPPVGYKLSKAVGTTYSLDLETLTAIAIALGIQEDTDSKIMHNPIALLKALQRVSDKVIVFCEDGQIKFPEKQSALTLLLEKIIVPVALPKKKNTNSFPSFHPKTWTIEYENKNGEKLYKFIVLSRNITFDRSWDVAFSITGKKVERECEQSKPISWFLSFLKSQVKNTTIDHNEKKRIITSLEKSILHTYFSLDSKNFRDWSVLPIGIGPNSYNITKDSLMTDSFHELVVMSPFISKSVIDRFCGWDKILTNCKMALFTRKSEISKLSEYILKRFNVYTLRDEIIDGENELSEDSNELDKEIRQHDIHAKIYMRKKGSQIDFYLGSMNATHAAMSSNVEMMLKLNTTQSHLNYDILTSSFFCGDEYASENPFQKISSFRSEENSDNEISQLENELKSICRINRTCSVTENNGRYDINVIFDSIPEDIECYISPICSNKEQALSTTMTFRDLDLIQISEMFKIRIVGKDVEINRVIFIHMENMPSERDAAVINKVIENKRAFIEYIAAILDDDFLSTILQHEKINKSGIFKKSPDLMPAIYEKMLKTSLENPNKLAEIDYVIKMISDEEIISNEFRETYETFKRTLRIK